jgi:hypothetical protein
MMEEFSFLTALKKYFKLNSCNRLMPLPFFRMSSYEQFFPDFIENKR